MSSSIPQSPPSNAPEPLSARDLRQRLNAQRQRIRAEQTAGHLPAPAPAPRPTGVPAAARKFSLEEISALRIPVVVSEAAQVFLIASSSEGRMLPLALSEAFGRANAEHGGAVVRVEIDLARKSDHFPLAADETDPITGSGEPLLLIVHAIHADEQLNPKRCGQDRWLINAADLCELHPVTRELLYKAHKHTAEIVRLYPHKHHPAPVVVETTGDPTDPAHYNTDDSADPKNTVQPVPPTSQPTAKPKRPRQPRQQKGT